MKNSTINFIFSLLVVGFISACGEDEFQILESEAPTAEDVIIDVSPTAENPNIVNFTTPSNGFIFKWDFGTGATAEGKTVQGTFALKGDYWIKLTLFNTGGSASDSVQINIAQTDFALLETPDLTNLTGGIDQINGKSWVIDSARAGHFGLGPIINEGAEVFTPDWFSAPPNDKAGQGMYDDEYIFSLVGFELEIDNNGDAFSIGVNSVDHGGDGGDDQLVTYNAPTNVTWALTEEDGRKYLSLSEGAFIGAYTGVSRYEILTLEENQLVLRFFDSRQGEFAWYHTLIPAGYAPVVDLDKPTLPMDFESTLVDYTFNNFDGGSTTVIDNPQSSGINTSTKVARMVKGAGEAWGGSSIQLDGPIDFSIDKHFKMQVWVPNAGDKVTFKVEDSSNPDNNMEVEATTVDGNAWEELIFDFSTINTANSYDNIVIIFENGTVGDGGADFTYYFDGIELTADTGGGGGGGGDTSNTLGNPPLDFESTTDTYTWTDFDGGVATVIANPVSGGINTSATVGQMVKGAGEVWGGSFITLDAPVDFSKGTTLRMKVYVPNAGDMVLLKLEDSDDANNNMEINVATTVAGEWEDLSFDFSTINMANTYENVVLIFENGTAGDGGADFTYYFDDIRQETSGGGGGGGTTNSILGNPPLDFESTTDTYTWNDFDGGVATVIANPVSGGINTSATVGQMVKGAGEVWGGSFIALDAPVDFSKGTTLRMKVYVPNAGDMVLLKLEDSDDANNNMEIDVATTVAGEWENLSFDFSGINMANTYENVVLIFENGTAGDGGADFTYYFDDISQE